MITWIYVNAEKHSATPATIESDLQAYYDLLDVDMIDIVSRRFGNTYYDVICDEEALLKADPIISMIDSGRRPMLFGNLFIVKHDGEGREILLTQADVRRIMKCFKLALSNKGFVNIMVGNY